MRLCKSLRFLSGSNASEFSLTSNCAASLAPAASCTASIVFSPVSTGQTAAMLTVTDDAPGSPQSTSINGTAVAAFSVAPASGSSTSATVSAGQSAQYQLQLTPGTGFTGTVGLSCTGATLGAVCQVPASVSLANGSATFTVTVTTSGPAQLPPAASLPASLSRTPSRLNLVRSAFLLFGIFPQERSRIATRPPQASHGLLRSSLRPAIFYLTFALAGCGGGSASVTPPPPVITPSGTSTITISLSATSSTGQPLQLRPI